MCNNSLKSSYLLKRSSKVKVVGQRSSHKGQNVKFLIFRLLSENRVKVTRSRSRVTRSRSQGLISRIPDVITVSNEPDGASTLGRFHLYFVESRCSDVSSVCRFRV